MEKIDELINNYEKRLDFISDKIEESDDNTFRFVRQQTQYECYNEILRELKELNKNI